MLLEDAAIGDYLQGKGPLPKGAGLFFDKKIPQVRAVNIVKGETQGY